MRLRSASALLLVAAAAATLLVATTMLSQTALATPSKSQPPPSSSSLNRALDYISLDANKQRFIKDLLDLVSIPSISSLPERKPDVERAATWCSERLKEAGLENVRIIRSATEDDDADGGAGGKAPSSPPAVYGDWLHAGPNKAVVLVYGHFDVQPADGEAEPWTSPPFEPVVRGGAVWGRGAQVRKKEAFFVAFYFLFFVLLDLPKNLTNCSLSSSSSSFSINRMTREASWGPSKPSKPSSREGKEKNRLLLSCRST